MATWRLSPERLRHPIAPGRVRRPPASGFGWVDRRLVTGGHLARLTPAESLLYFFLCTVADAQGLSFWGDARIASQLRLRPEDLDRARTDLERRGLILYRPPLYQLLPLPAELGPPEDRAPRQSVRIDPLDDLPSEPKPLSALLRLPKRP